MAVVVVFGLMVATFLTLLVVPTLYLFLDNLRNMRKKPRSPSTDRRRRLFFRQQPIGQRPCS
jgi:predicted RND superfamily exporter protein